MSAPILIPFNFQPSNTGSVSNAGYTVPTGKYAYVNISLSGAAYRSDTNSLTSGSSISPLILTESNLEKNLSVWLKSGDVLTISRTNASASFGSLNNWNISSATTVTVSLNSVIIASIYCPARYAGAINSGSTSGTIAGDSHVGITYAEYDNIS